MSDDVFRMIVAVGVVIAALSFVVQAIVGVVVLGVARKLQEKMLAVVGRAEPLIDRAGPAIDQVGPAIQKINGIVDRVHPLMDQVGPVIARVGPVIDQAKPAVAKIEPAIQRVSDLLETARDILEETRPQIRQATAQVVDIARVGKAQALKVGEFLSDAGDMARTRLEQIDATVGSTVEGVEQVSQGMKRAVTRPVREVNGIAAGVAAAVSTLVKGPRRSSVDSATQDEEMFI